MGFRALTQRADIERAWGKFRAAMRRGAVHVSLRERWKGGAADSMVDWHEGDRVWSSFHNRWSSFGVEDPRNRPTQYIVCQIDPAPSGINRRYAGVFLRDDHDNVYIAHSGKIGGGRKGIGKEAFRRHYRGGNYQTVTWRDGQETDVMAIGRLDSPRLPAQVGQFVNEVARIKDLVATGAVGATKRGKHDSFRPEFHGRRAVYKPSGIVESTCDHGLVVDALRQVLRDRLGVEPANDTNRDLYIPASPGLARVLFEVKTDTSLGSIYGAIGQLFFHGACQPRMPKLAAVVPGVPDTRTDRALNKLGIHIVRYEWDGEKLRFPNLIAAVK
jgi:hypothetical protein